jgi:hypothetical protein
MTLGSSGVSFLLAPPASVLRRTSELLRGTVNCSRGRGQTTAGGGRGSARGASATSTPGKGQHRAVPVSCTLAHRLAVPGTLCSSSSRLLLLLTRIATLRSLSLTRSKLQTSTSHRSTAAAVVAAATRHEQ